MPKEDEMMVKKKNWFARPGKHLSIYDLLHQLNSRAMSLSTMKTIFVHSLSKIFSYRVPPFILAFPVLKLIEDPKEFVQS